MTISGEGTPSSSTPGSTLFTILYIEDDPASQTLVKRMLEFQGYRVLVAATGLAGIDLAHECQPDLILMDINLPDLSGREVTTRLRTAERFKDTPIVALTAQGQEVEREKAFAAGLDGYIVKPIDVDALPARIAEYLAGRRDHVDAETLARGQAAYSQEVVERLEAKLRELEASYGQLKKLDNLKEAFIQLTAHELRTPLTLIYGYGRLLQTSPVVAQMMQDSGEINSLIVNLVQAIDRMSAVISEILLISRVASGQTEPVFNVVQVATLVERVVEDFRLPLEQRRLTIETELDQAPATLYADRGLLALALGNLLSNAIKYTPDGGRITIRAVQEEGNALISVRDTGIGIDPQDHHLIFESFYTTGSTHLHSTSKVAFRGGGLGLGLVICKEIVQAHSGKIWVESPGCDEASLPGSTFYVSLPLKSRQAGALLLTEVI